MRSDGGQRCHFPSELSPPSLHTGTGCPKRISSIQPSDPGGRRLSVRASAGPADPARRLEDVREASETSPSSAYGFISAHSWGPNSISRLSAVLMQTSGWIATPVHERKGPGHTGPDKGTRLVRGDAEKPKRRFPVLLSLKNDLMTRANLWFQAPARSAQVTRKCLCDVGRLWPSISSWRPGWKDVVGRWEDVVEVVLARGCGCAARVQGHLYSCRLRLDLGQGGTWDFQQAGLISCAGSRPGQALGTRVLDQEHKP